MNLASNKNIKGLVLLTSLLAFSVQAQISGVDYHWEEKRSKDNIQIYTSEVAGSPFRAVRGVMQLKGTVDALVALVDDLPNCKNWADLCKESRIVKSVLPTENYVYVYNDIPFPVKDRDVVAHVIWKKELQSGRVSMLSAATKISSSVALVAQTSQAIRLTRAVSQWHFTPLANGLVKVENFAHIDPGGPTPAWITNMMLVNSPYKTMQNMRDIIESGKYAHSPSKF